MNQESMLKPQEYKFITVKISFSPLLISTVLEQYVSADLSRTLLLISQVIACTFVLLP